MIKKRRVEIRIENRDVVVIRRRRVVTQVPCGQCENGALMVPLSEAVAKLRTVPPEDYEVASPFFG